MKIYHIQKFINVYVYINLSSIESQNTNCSISGSGDIKVNAQKSLIVAISGSILSQTFVLLLGFNCSLS